MFFDHKVMTSLKRLILIVELFHYWHIVMGKFAPPFVDFNSHIESFFSIRFFVTFNIILLGNFPEKINDNKHTELIWTSLKLV